VTLGRDVVYVVGRGDDHRGGVFHQPGESVEHLYATKCGRGLGHATLMQREWASHTGAEACRDCFPKG
jgi:hypothetical protein